MVTPSAGHQLTTAAKEQALLMEPTRITLLMTFSPSINWLLAIPEQTVKLTLPPQILPNLLLISICFLKILYV